MDLAGLCGKYKLERSENFEEYLKETGTNLLWRKAMCRVIKYACCEITFDSASETWHMKASIGPLSQPMTWKLGISSAQTQFDGRNIEAVMHHTSKNATVQYLTYCDNGIKATITREWSANGIFMTYECRNVVATQFYKRIE